jgi:hypothetical protein
VYRLLSFPGPEGDEARIILKEIRSQQQPFRLSSPHGKTPDSTRKGDKMTSGTPLMSALFSPWKRFSYGSSTDPSYHQDVNLDSEFADMPRDDSQMSVDSHL